jgi:hypothetical protein
VVQVVSPGARDLDEPLLDTHRLEQRRVPRLGAEHVVDSDKRGFRQQERPIAHAGGERFAEDRGDPLPVLGVEAVAWHEHEARHKTLEVIAAHEQAHALALPDREDAHRDLKQRVLGDLQQLVAWIDLEYLEQRLAIVAVGGEAGAPEHVGDLATQDRDLLRKLLVGQRRVEPEKAALTDDLTV